MSNDLIRREDVMLRVREFIGNKSYDELMLVNDLNALPSVDPERKKGEWIYDGKRGRFPACKCSICGYYENADWALLQGANFCSNCGADMRGDHE